MELTWKHVYLDQKTFLEVVGFFLNNKETIHKSVTPAFFLTLKFSVHFIVVLLLKMLKLLRITFPITKHFFVNGIILIYK